MKKKITILMLLSSIYGFSQNINFIDSEFKSKLLQINSSNISTANLYAEDLNGNSTAVDLNGDGEIQVSEAQNIKKLKLTSPSSTLLISSASEISFFSNLTELNLSKNNLSEIDLTNLLLLEKINFSENNISLLNVSFLQNLKTLMIQNNSLTNLDVSNKGQLYLLYADGNQLTNLNLENTNGLQTLSCSNNLLTTLDISDSPIDIFYAHNNNLESLNMNNGLISSSLHIFNLAGNTNLNKVCADTGEINWLQNYLSSVGINNVDISNCTTLSINHNIFNDDNIEIFPNPTSDYLYVKTVNSPIQKLTIHNIDGKLLFEKQSNQNNEKLNLNNFAKGTYIITINQNNNTISKKFIKK